MGGRRWGINVHTVFAELDLGVKSCSDISLLYDLRQVSSCLAFRCLIFKTVVIRVPSTNGIFVKMCQVLGIV